MSILPSFENGAFWESLEGFLFSQFHLAGAPYDHTAQRLVAVATK
jgi:hypothetical protein